MPDQVDTEPRDSPDGQPGGDVAVESYRTDRGVVFFDAENPLAWLEASRTVRLSDCV